MTKFIAERKLMYSLKGGNVRRNFSVYLSAPYLVDQATVNFSVGNGCFGCDIQILGLDENPEHVYGADSLQAVNLASNAVEPFLKRLQKKYDLFWLTGEGYFED